MKTKKSVETRTLLIILLLFILIKCILLLNSTVLGIILSSEEGNIVLTVWTVFILLLFIYYFIFNKYIKKDPNSYFWTPVICLIALASMIHFAAGMMLFSGIFFLLLISSESFLIKTLDEKLNFKKTNSLVVSAIPLLLNFLPFFPLMIYSSAFYILQTITSFLLSFSDNNIFNYDTSNKTYQDTSSSPLFTSIPFILISFLFYYFVIPYETNIPLIFKSALIGFVMTFYAGGASLFIYYLTMKVKNIN